MRIHLLAIGLIALGIVPAANAAERNIIFFITDDQSPTLGCYGDPLAASPHVDALAKDGTLFKHAFATTASCSPSRSVILSGLHNHTNGQYGLQHAEHHFSSFDTIKNVALPRALTNAGYRTGHIGKLHVAPEEVYHFDTYLQGNARNTVKLVEACRGFMTAQDDKPFFLYIGATDPHRSGGVQKSSSLEFKPDLFGNPASADAVGGMVEVVFDPQKIPVPEFLPDTPECRAELAQYYQSCARIDRGFGRLIEILKETGLFDKTLVIFTSDHGIAMPGAKTTVYDPGLRVPFVVRNPYTAQRGVVSDAIISHIDIAPSLLDFAGAPKQPQKGENKTPARKLSYPGKSWIPILSEANPSGWDTIYASHTFHEVQMYYPMRAVRDRKYKLIWNVASDLPFPFASDLWNSATWQRQLKDGLTGSYGLRPIQDYIQRPKFELYDIESDPHELHNLAANPEFAQTLQSYQEKLKTFQQQTADPWLSKWTYE